MIGDPTRKRNDKSSMTSQQIETAMGQMKQELEITLGEKIQREVQEKLGATILTLQLERRERKMEAEV